MKFCEHFLGYFKAFLSPKVHVEKWYLPVPKKVNHILYPKISISAAPAQEKWKPYPITRESLVALHYQAMFPPIIKWFSGKQTPFWKENDLFFSFGTSKHAMSACLKFTVSCTHPPCTYNYSISLPILQACYKISVYTYDPTDTLEGERTHKWFRKEKRVMKSYFKRKINEYGKQG